MILTVVALAALLAMTGLAIDLGHVYVIKSELQRAADAGALAGAEGLFYPANTSWPQCAQAQTQGQVVARANLVDSSQPTVAAPLTGRWDWSAAQDTDAFMENCSSSPTYFTNAVRVTATRENVSLFLMSILGMNPFRNISVTATAAMILPAGSGFPWAISKSCYNSKKNNTDAAHKVRLGSTYHYPEESDSGQWTSFTSDKNSASYIKGLIDHGSTAPGLSVGDSIWIQPGTEAALFGKKDAGTRINQMVIFPVVDADDLSVKNHYPIVSFATFYITDTDQGGKYLEGYFGKTDTVAHMAGGMAHLVR